MSDRILEILAYLTIIVAISIMAFYAGSYSLSKYCENEFSGIYVVIDNNYYCSANGQTFPIDWMNND